MTLDLIIQPPDHTDFSPRITVIGVGGGGTNAVDNMIAANLQGVEFVVANTDAQQLMHSRATRRIQLGPHITQGLGAGAKPEVGRAAAEEAADELNRHLDNTHMVFITAGMGGGTGTGAAPVIARMARERNILTVGVVTKPFGFEGIKRSRSADAGIEELQQYVDTLIVIPNQNLFRMATERTTWKEAFKMADQVLYMGVRGVTDLMLANGLINLDFADIRAVMAEMGKAMMGTGEADGENRAVRAAEAAINNPLLDDTSMRGAKGLLVNITGGEDLTLFEVDEAVTRIRSEVDEEANVIFGSAIEESLNGRIRVSVVATGIDRARDEPQAPRLVSVNGGPKPAPQPIPVPGGMSNTGPVAASQNPIPQMRPTSPLREAQPELDTRAFAQPEQTRPPVVAPPLTQPSQPPRFQPKPPAAATFAATTANQEASSLFTTAVRSQAPAASEMRGSTNPPPPPPPQHGGSSIFARVTGRFGWRSQPAREAQPQRQEAPRQETVPNDARFFQPQMAQQPMQPTDEAAPMLDIPTFLRRQGNTP